MVSWMSWITEKRKVGNTSLRIFLVRIKSVVFELSSYSSSSLSSCSTSSPSSAAVALITLLSRVLCSEWIDNLFPKSNGGPSSFLSLRSRESLASSFVIEERTSDFLFWCSDFFSLALKLIFFFECFAFLSVSFQKKYYKMRKLFHVLLARRCSCKSRDFSSLLAASKSSRKTDDLFGSMPTECRGTSSSLGVSFINCSTWASSISEETEASFPGAISDSWENGWSVIRILAKINLFEKYYRFTELKLTVNLRGSLLHGILPCLRSVTILQV